MKNSMRAIKKLTAGLMLLLCALTTVADTREDLDKAKEYQVKALFLYNFANFVEWPETAFNNAKAPLTLCIFGETGFDRFLSEVEGTLIGTHPLKVIRTNKKTDIESGCHMLFVSYEQRVRLPEFFTKIKYMYVLSVGDREGFADKGGIINIVRTQDQMQFEINLTTALNNGLWVSSDLLSLAREVKRLDQGGLP